MKRFIKLHIFKKNSRMVASPLACVQLISLFLYEKKQHFSIQNTIKIYTKTQLTLNYDLFKKKIPGAVYLCGAIG